MSVQGIWADGRQSEVTILLIEDDLADVLLTRMTLKTTRMCNDLRVAKGGVESMEFLRHAGRFKEMPRPDLNMPRIEGSEVLMVVKNDGKRCLVDFRRRTWRFLNSGN